jgi:aminopeptidase N
MLFLPLDSGDTTLLLSAARQITLMFFPSPQAWIREGLASYAQVRLIEEKEGRKAAIRYLESHRSVLVESPKPADSSETAETGPLLNHAEGVPARTKAMYVWLMLRQMIGDGALQTALHNYKAGDDHSPNYIEKRIEAEAHRDLQWFFDDWVYQDRGLPDFRITSVYPSALASGGYMVTVTVENFGRASAEVPVTLHFETGEASEKLVVPGKSKASIRMQTASPPVSATVNDGTVPESDMTNNQYQIESLHH